MPPSKKKKGLRALSHALQLNTCLQAEPKNVIEQLFLLRRFDDALELSYNILSEMCNREEDEDKVHKNKQPVQNADEPLELQDKIMHLRHSCKDTEICGCSAIVVLVIQILYEMGKATSATPFACKFYRDVAYIPYDIVFVCVNLLVNSLTNFAEAKRILTTALDLTKINQQGLVTAQPCRKVVTHTPEQREILFEFLVFHVMAPLNETQDAIDLLSHDKTLSPQKKEGWTTCLHELHKTHLLKIQQQQEQQKQQRHSPPLNSNPSSTTSPSSLPTTNSTNPNSHNNNSNNKSLPNKDSLSLQPTSIMHTWQAMVASSRRKTIQIWQYLRTILRSRFGSVALGIAVTCILVHFLSSLRRSSHSSRQIEGNNDENDGNRRRTNNNTRNTNNNNTNNNNRPRQKTKPSNRSPPQRHYGGIDQIGGSWWSSVTELLSGALSLK